MYFNFSIQLTLNLYLILRIRKRWVSWIEIKVNLYIKIDINDSIGTEKYHLYFTKKIDYSIYFLSSDYL